MEVVTQQLTRERSYGFAREGSNCAELVEAFAPPIDREFVLVLINGVEVPQHLWAVVTPKQGATVIIGIVPGKGGKKNPFAMIASIALSIVAPQLSLAIWAEAGAVSIGFGMTVGSLTTMAIGFVGNAIIGAIFKPSVPKMGGGNLGYGSSPAASPTYSIQGQSNQADPYGPVRRLFGRHRIYPVVVGKPYVDIVGDDQYLNVVYDIGAGDYDVGDVRIGMSQFNYFKSAEYFVHRNTMTPSLQWYSSSRHSDQYNIRMDTNWAMADSAVDTGQMQVNFMFPMGIAAIDKNSGNTHSHTVVFDVQWSEFGTGNWKTLDEANRWSSSRSIAPDETGSTMQIIDNGQLMYSDAYGYRNGYAKGATSMIMQTVDGRSWGAGSKFSLNGTTYTITAGAISPTPSYVTFSPALQQELIIQAFTDEGGMMYLQPLDVSIYYRSGNWAITDGRMVQLGLQIQIRPDAVPVAGKRYSIRVKQISGAGDEKYVFGDMFFVGLTTLNAVQPAIKLRKAHTLLECRVKANDQISGTLDNVSCLAHSWLWVRRNGVWSYELSNNPAWALLEVLRGPLNKRPIPDSKIDLDSFERWAAYCDSPHPNHGLPRCEFDHVVDYYSTIFQLAQTITAAGRATLMPGDAKYGIIIDKEQTTPIQVFTPHNSTGFKGTRTFIPAPHAFRAKYFSRETWKMEECVVYNDGYDYTNATIFESMEEPGVTRYDQVWCDGRYRMAQGIHRQESWSLDVDLENLIATRGDMVHVAHDVPKLGGLPARIKSVIYDGSGNATQWTLTEPVQLGAVPTDYGYTIRSLDGVTHFGQFAAQVDAYTVQPTAPVPGISMGDLHVWGEMQHITYPFLVAKIDPQQNLAATLTLVPYAGDAIFNADMGTIPPYVPVIDTDLSSLAPAPVLRTNVLQRIQYIDRRPFLSVSFDWGDYISADAVQYEVWVDWDLNPTKQWTLLGRTATPSFQWLRDIDLSVYKSYPGSGFCAKIVSVNGFGVKRTLNETPSTCDEILGDYVPPGAPTTFDLDLKRDTITLSWTPPSDPDIDHYDIRYDPNFENSSYTQSTIVATGIPWPRTSVEVPARLGTYYIKTVDTSGNRSEEFAEAYTPGENLWNMNAITKVDDQPIMWPGAKVGFETVGGTPIVYGDFSPAFSADFSTVEYSSGSTLVSSQLADGVYPMRSEYYYNSTFDAGDIYQTRFTSKIMAAGFNATSMMVAWVPLAIAVPIAGWVITDTDQKVGIGEMMDVWHEIRWADLAYVMADWVPLASADPIGYGGAQFGEWRRFQVGDYTGKVFQFRLIAEYIGPDAVADAGVVIGGAYIEVDMPDRIDGVYDVRCPPGGMRVYYAPAFKERPAIGITADTVSEGDTYRISNADKNGFDIEFKNAGISVERQFDWLAKGYGAKGTRVVPGVQRLGVKKAPVFVLTKFT